MSKGTLQLIVEHFASALEPLEHAFSDDGAFIALMRRLGWNATDRPAAFGGLSVSVKGIVDLKVALGDDASLEQIKNILTSITNFQQALAGISAVPSGISPADLATFRAELPRRIRDLVVADYLVKIGPQFSAVIEALGVSKTNYLPSTAGRPSFPQLELSLAPLIEIFGDPKILLEKVYGWGGPDFRIGALHRQLLNFALGIGLPAATFGESSVESAAAFAGPNSRPLRGAVIPIYTTKVGGKLLQIGFAVYGLPATATKKPGLVIEPLIPKLGTTAAIEVPLGDRVVLKIRAGVDLDQTFGLILRPGEVEVNYPLGGGLPAAGFGAEFIFTAPETKTLIGAPKSTRLEMKRATAAAEIEHREGKVEARGRFKVEDLALVVSTGDQDGFLSKLFGGKDVRLEFPFGLEWSNKDGLRFSGSAKFEATLNPHLKLGPLTAEELQIGLRAHRPSGGGPRLDLDATASISGSLGPIAFSLQQLGLRFGISVEDGGAAPIDLDLGFKPPTGAGLRVNAGMVTGGGFLSFDHERGRYAGILQLQIAKIAVKAIGLIDTKYPDGSKGFSLLIAISAEFQPIQLGFGFTLLGVGGLIAVNRTIAVEPLRQGLRANTLDSILFPPDPIRDANRLISDLRTVFPPAPDRFIFGPMAKIGWGTPALLTAKLGLFLELPPPIRLVLIGQVHCALPREDAALVVLNVDVLGVLDFEKGELAIDASIHDSRILIYALSGDMALRIRWLSDPIFILSFGGLHPSFPAPPGFPTLRRIQVSMGTGNNPRLNLDTYLTVSSNSLQFGARLELYAAAIGFNVYGYLGFDVLFIFSPFSFEARIYAGVALRRGTTNILAISLDFLLAGPTPWRAAGTATFKILFLKLSFDFDASWGDPKKIGAPSPKPWDELQKVLVDPRSWSAVLPASVERVVSLREDPNALDTIRLDPAGELEFRQKILPFGLKLTRFGNGIPQPPDFFEVSAVYVAGRKVGTTAIKDWFAPSQFREMDDAERLSSASFVEMKAGVRAGDDAVQAGTPIVMELRYETILIDKLRPAWTKLKDWLGDSLMHSLAPAALAARPRLSRRATKRFLNPSAKPITVRPEGFVIAATETLKKRSDLIAAAEGMPEPIARQILQDHLRAHPADRGRLQVIPSYEAQP